ncbi:hypothetical protein ES705_08986 [subsurface metagenome]
MGIQWEGRDLVKSYKLTKDNQVMATYTDGKVMASEVFKKKVVDTYRKRFKRDLWADLKEVGITPDTLIPQVQEIPWLKEGDTLKGFTYISPNEKLASYLFLLPNDPPGRDIARRIPTSKDNIDTVINMWWLKNVTTKDGNTIEVPFGILPAAFSVKENGKPSEYREYAGKQSVNICFGEDESQRREVTCFRYNITNAHDKKRAVLYTPSGRLAAREYDYVVHRLANVYPIIKGKEIVYYDPFGKPVEARLDTDSSQVTKKWLKIIYEGEGGETQIVKEREPIIGEKRETAEYYYDIFGNLRKPMKIKDVIGDSIRELRENKAVLYRIIGLASFVVILLIVEKILGKIMHWWSKKTEKRIKPPAGTKPPSIDEPSLRNDIRERLTEIGVTDHENYYVEVKLVNFIKNSKSEKYRELFPLTNSSLKEWRSITKRDGGEIEDDLMYVVLIEWITEQMNKGGVALIAYCPNLLLYLLDKSISLYNQDEKKDIAKEIRDDIGAIEKFLRSEYGKKVINRDQVTYDDFIDLFENKHFLNKYEEAPDKLEFYKKEGLNLKTYKDRIGYFTFLKNLWPVAWLPIVFTIGIIGGSLLQVIGITHISYLHIAIISIVLTSLYILYDTIRFAMHEKIDKLAFYQIARFTIFLTINSAIWAMFNWLMGIETWKAVLGFFELGIGWGIYLGLPVAILGFSFIFLSIFTFPKVISTFFTFYQGTREGVGQVKTWEDAREKYSDAKRRFIELMIPEEVKYKWEGREEDVWKKYWVMFVERLAKIHKITEEEEKQRLLKEDLSKAPRDPEAREIIQDLIGSWLMHMPYALYWNDLPTLTAMITAFAEEISYPFDDLNSPEEGGKITKLNKLISVYYQQWGVFAASIGDKDISKTLTSHAEDVKKGNLLKKLSPNLPDDIKTQIEIWVANRMVPVSKTVREVALIRDAYRLFAEINFPELTKTKEGREKIEELIDDKLQILLNYEGRGIPEKVTEVQKKYLEALMQEHPAVEARLEVWWAGDTLYRYDPDKKEIIDIGKAPAGKPVLGGKPYGQNAILPFVRGEKVLFFDANASVRLEEAIKLPMGLAEFNKDPKLKEVLFGEEIYNRPYSWTTEAFGLGDATWTNEVQRFLNMFGACGFYGHSAIIDREALITAGGFTHRYSGEDTMLSIRLMLKGYRTTHKEYMHFGKSREAWFFGALTPGGRWSQNTAEYALSRWGYRLLRSHRVHIGQKVFNVEAWSFFYKKPIIPLANYIYLGWVVLLGVSGFVNLKFLLIMGIMGLLLNQGGSFPAWVYLVLRKGFVRGASIFISLFPKLHSFYTALIPTYGMRFHNAIARGQGGFDISGKGFGLKHLAFEEIYGKEEIEVEEGGTKKKVKKKWLGLPRTFVAQLMIVIILSGLTFIPIQSLQLVSIVMLTAGLPLIWLGLIIFFPYIRDAVWPKDPTKRSAIKIQILFGLPLIAFILRGIWAWGGVLTYWYWWLGIFGGMLFYYIGSFSRTPWVKKLFIPLGLGGSIFLTLYAGIKVNPIFILISFSSFYILTGLTTVLTPLLGFSQPLLWLKERGLWLDRRFSANLKPLSWLSRSAKTVIRRALYLVARSLSDNLDKEVSGAELVEWINNEKDQIKIGIKELAEAGRIGKILEYIRMTFPKHIDYQNFIELDLIRNSMKKEVFKKLGGFAKRKDAQLKNIRISGRKNEDVKESISNLVEEFWGMLTEFERDCLISVFGSIEEAKDKIYNLKEVGLKTLSEDKAKGEVNKIIGPTSKRTIEIAKKFDFLTGEITPQQLWEQSELTDGEKDVLLISNKENLEDAQKAFYENVKNVITFAINSVRKAEYNYKQTLLKWVNSKEGRSFINATLGLFELLTSGATSIAEVELRLKQLWLKLNISQRGPPWLETIFNFVDEFFKNTESSSIKKLVKDYKRALKNADGYWEILGKVRKESYEKYARRKIVSEETNRFKQNLWPKYNRGIAKVIKNAKKSIRKKGKFVHGNITIYKGEIHKLKKYLRQKYEDDIEKEIKQARLSLKENKEFNYQGMKLSYSEDKVIKYAKDLAYKDVEKVAPLLPVILRKILNQTQDSSSSQKSQGKLSSRSNIILLFLTLSAVTLLSGCAGDSAGVSAGLGEFIATHPVITVVVGLGVGIGLIFAIWRVFFPVSWYRWRINRTNSRYEELEYKERKLENLVRKLIRRKNLRVTSFLIEKLHGSTGFTNIFIKALGETGDKRTIELIIPFLSSLSYRKDVVEALNKLGASREQIIKGCIQAIQSSESFNEKQMFISTLVELGVDIDTIFSQYLKESSRDKVISDFLMVALLENRESMQKIVDVLIQRGVSKEEIINFIIQGGSEEKLRVFTNGRWRESKVMLEYLEASSEKRFIFYSNKLKTWKSWWWERGVREVAQELIKIDKSRGIELTRSFIRELEVLLSTVPEIVTETVDYAGAHGLGEVEESYENPEYKKIKEVIESLQKLIPSYRNYCVDLGLSFILFLDLLAEHDVIYLIPVIIIILISYSSYKRFWEGRKYIPTMNKILVEQAIETGKVNLNYIRDENLKSFLKFLRDNGLEEVVIIGGAVRDILFGKKVDDIDISIKIKLTDVEREEFTRSTAPASERVYNEAMSILDKLANALGVFREQLLSPGKYGEVQFKGIDVEYAGPIEVIASNGKKVLIKQIVVDGETGKLYSSTGPGLLQMAMDCDGNLYGHTKSLNDLLEGKVRLVGDGKNFFLGAALRTLRLKYQFGLTLSKELEVLMQQVLADYREGRLLVPAVYIPSAERLINKILATAIDRKSANRELKELGIFSLIRQAKKKIADLKQSKDANIGKDVTPEDHEAKTNPEIAKAMKEGRFIRVKRDEGKYLIEKGGKASSNLFPESPVVEALNIALDVYGDDPKTIQQIDSTTHIFLTPEDTNLSRAPPFIWNEDLKRYEVAHAGRGLEHKEQNSYIPYVLIYRLITLLNSLEKNSPEYKDLRELIALIVRHEAKHAWEKATTGKTIEDEAHDKEVREIIEKVESYLNLQPDLSAPSEEIGDLDVLQQVYRASEEACEREMISSTPSADVIVITAGNKAMAEMYEKIYTGPSRIGVTSRPDVPIIVVPDPEGPKIGNGGALFNSIAKLDEELPELADNPNYLHLKGKKLEDLRIVLIQAGGFGTRVALTLAHGSKTCMRVPAPLGREELMASIMDLVIRGSYKFTQALERRGQSGLVVLNGDGLLVTEPEIRDGISLIVYPESKMKASGKLGVVVIDEKTGKVLGFKEKPDMSKDRDYRTGIISANTASFILTDKDPAEYKDVLDAFLIMAGVIKRTPVEVDTSNELFLPYTLLKDPDALNKHLQKRTKGDETKKKVYALVYEMVSEFPPLYAVGHRDKTFYRDLGTTETYVDELLREGLLSKIYSFRKRIGSFVSTTSEVSEHTHIYRSFIDDETRVGNSIIYYSADLAPGSVVGDSSLVAARGKVEVGNNQVLTHVPVMADDKLVFATVYTAISDDVKKTINEDATIFGVPILEWLKRYDFLTPGENMIIGKDITVLTGKTILFELPIWPVIDTDSVDMGLIAWMADPNASPPEKYINAPKMSLDDITKNQQAPQVYKAIEESSLDLFKKISQQLVRIFAETGVESIILNNISMTPQLGETISISRVEPITVKAEVSITNVLHDPLIGENIVAQVWSYDSVVGEWESAPMKHTGFIADRYVFEGQITPRADSSRVDFVVRVSVDGGNTWSYANQFGGPLDNAHLLIKKPPQAISSKGANVTTALTFVIGMGIALGLNMFATLLGVVGGLATLLITTPLMFAVSRHIKRIEMASTGYIRAGPAIYELHPDLATAVIDPTIKDAISYRDGKIILKNEKVRQALRATPPYIQSLIVLHEKHHFKTRFKRINEIPAYALMVPLAPVVFGLYLVPAIRDRFISGEKDSDETELDKQIKENWLDRLKRGVFLVTPEQIARTKIQRDIGPFRARLTPHEKKLRKMPWADMPVNLNLPFAPEKFNFSKIKPEEVLVDKLNLAGNNWRVIINASPTEQYASLLVPEKASNEFLYKEDINAFLE